MNRSPQRCRWLVIACSAVLLVAGGCAETGDQPLVTTVNQPVAEALPPTPPPELLVHVRVGSLPRVLDSTAAVGRRLGAWNLGPGELWPLVQQLLGAFSDLTDIVDWRRAVHVLVLDPAASQGTLAFILPARQPERALGRLSSRCRARRRGPHWIFSGGGQGLLPCRFAARSLEGGILVAPRLSSLQRLWRFALLTAHQDTGGGPALEARVFARAGLAKLGLTAQKLDQLAKVGSLGLAMATGDLDAAPRIEAQLTRLFAYATSARDVGLAVSLGADEVRLKLFATARQKGALRSYIQSRQKAISQGAPGLRSLAALPRRAPVLLALRGRAAAPQGKPAGPPSPGLILSALLTRLPADLRQPLGRFGSRLLGDQGATRVALEPLDTGGLCLVALVDHPKPATLDTAVHRDLSETMAGLRKHLKGRGFGDQVFQSSIQRRAAIQVQEIRLGGKWPARALGQQLLLQWLAGGDTLRLATATQGRHLVIALGAGAEHQAQAVLSRLKRPATAARPGPLLPGGRLGRVRLSLVELVRAVPILGVGMTLPKRDTGALDLHWGVNPQRGQLDATLHLPLGHLVASAPLWKWLFDKLAAQGKALSALTPPSGPEPEDAL